MQARVHLHLGAAKLSELAAAVWMDSDWEATTNFKIAQSIPHPPCGPGPNVSSSLSTPSAQPKIYFGKYGLTSHFSHWGHGVTVTLSCIWSTHPVLDWSDLESINVTILDPLSGSTEGGKGATKIQQKNNQLYSHPRIEGLCYRSSRSSSSTFPPAFHLFCSCSVTPWPFSNESQCVSDFVLHTFQNRFDSIIVMLRAGVMLHFKEIRHSTLFTVSNISN